MIEQNLKERMMEDGEGGIHPKVQDVAYICC